MADTLESIYLNTALGATELDDGEHTILTTNSTTRYVIKDMYVNGTSDLSGTYLELNGFNVGSISSNATGSLIIPPNSTLKIKSTDYPYSFQELTQFANYANTGNSGLKVSYQNASTKAEVGTAKEFYYAGLPTGSSVTDVQYTGNSPTYSEDVIHYTTNDSNSSQQLKYWRPSNTSTGNIRQDSYKPFGMYKNYGYYMESTSFREHDLLTDPFGTGWSVMSQSGLFTGGYSPFSTSSYPRSRASHGWYWFFPSSAYSTNLFGIKLEGANKGQFIDLNLVNSHNSASTMNFVVSYNATTDILYVYRNSGTGTLLTNSYANWSTTDAIQNSNRQTIQPTTSAQETAVITANGAIDATNMSSVQFGYRSNGGFTYKNSSNSMVLVNPDMTVDDTITSITIDGNSFNGHNGSFWRKERTLTSSEATALSITAPTFGIQLLGIKSV